MTPRQQGLGALFAGIATVFVALLVGGHPARRVLGWMGVALIVAGLARFVLTLRGEPVTRPFWPVVLVTLLAVTLHGYESAVLLRARFSFGLVLWEVSPYVAPLAVSAFPATRAAAVAGALVALGFDLLVHHELFATPWDFASAFLLLARPLVNGLAVVPVAILVAWALSRCRRRRLSGAGRAGRPGAGSAST